MDRQFFSSAIQYVCVAEGRKYEDRIFMAAKQGALAFMQGTASFTHHLVGFIPCQTLTFLRDHLAQHSTDLSLPVTAACQKAGH